ncbi:MAG TPA: tripartite tricarboxylate transporter substrate-binding protein [Candidatus Binatia bacterium]|nr:tripartite tricarboxylate transporter substrate-binding protein [Candidatus Binatia bacterium]
MKLKFWFPAVIAAGLVLVGAAPSRSATDDFYKGKTIRIVVGFAAGGGFDTYSRVIGRHMGRFIPGNPSIIVENMTGAGSLVAANHVYRVAKPDGLTIGHFIGGLIMQQVMGGTGIEFDARKFEMIGVPVKENVVCALRKESGITSMESWLAAKTPVKLGGTAPGSTTDDVAKILREAIGLPIQLVSGYKGTADIRLAADSGEIAGGCWAWESVKVTWRPALEKRDVLVVLQAIPKSHPELTSVPLAINFAKTDEAKKLVDAGIHDTQIFTRPYVLPPGTPKERVQVLRKAFLDTIKDKEFLDEAAKSKLDVDPIPGEQVEKIVAGLFKLDPALLAKLKQILTSKQ